MQPHPFIFSNKLSYRLLRHLVFWFCWWVFCSIIYAYLPVTQILPHYKRFIISATEAFIFLGVHMFLTYNLVYFVVPHLLIKGRYLSSFVAVILLFIATGVLNAFVSPYVEGVRNFILHPFFQSLPKRFASRDFSYSLLAGLRGGITIGGLAAAIKLMKYWYVKEQSNLQLQKEKAQIQLQLLKAQVHPHFLFNTLNNIYSFTQTSSPVAAKMVAGLSDMLRYMLYEGDKPLVPLAKELNMLRDYIMLEQVRYGARLDVHIDIPDNTEDLYITSLILLPLVENCFKHGASNMVEQSWINMIISIEGDCMTMKLVNGKPRDYNSGKTGAGIGLQNVQKRLELIYPQQHVIKITEAEDVFIVDLKIELQRIAANKQIVMPVKLMPANA